MEPGGKSLVGAIVRAEQMHYIDKEEFTESISDLGIDVNDEYYDFDIQVQDKEFATVTATPKSDRHTGVAGGVSYLERDGTFATIICVADEKGTSPSPPSLNFDKTLACAPGSAEVQK